MSDLETYIERRKRKDHEFEEGFEHGYRESKIGVLLKQAREQAGLSQEELARRVGTKRHFPDRESRSRHQAIHHSKSCQGFGEKP